MPAAMEPDFMPPDEVSIGDGVAALRSAIERFKSANDSELQPSMAFGKMTRDEYNQLHMRHAEMHLSFIVPTN